MRRPLPKPVDHYRSWFPSIVAFVVKIVMEGSRFKIPFF
jgi:hypothetical protein